MGKGRRNAGASTSDSDRHQRRRLDDPAPVLEYAGWTPPARGAPHSVHRAPAAEMSPEKFYDTYVSKRRPVVLTGGLENTPWARCTETWTDGFLKNHPEGDSLVRVETRTDTNQSFGKGKYQQMRFCDFMERFSSGDDKLYLTASPASTDAHGRPSVASAPASFLVGETHPAQIPFRPKLAGNLVPANVNLWLGVSGNKSKSGLHHDHHDNLYVLLQGTKTFELYQPDTVTQMYTIGTPRKVHRNGLINYIEGGTSFEDGDAGGLKKRILSQKVRDAEAEVQAVLDTVHGDLDPVDTEWLRTAEEKLDDAMDATMGDFTRELRSDGDDDDDDSESGDENDFAGHDDFDDLSDSDLEFEEEEEDGFYQSEFEVRSEEQEMIRQSLQRNKERKEKLERDPPSFSQTSRAAPSDVPKNFPLFVKAQETRMMTTTVRAGEILFLPTGWFHEVSSSGDTSAEDGDRKNQKEGGNKDDKNKKHAALNYWFHPPLFGASFATPYGTQERQDMWESDWTAWVEMREDERKSREEPKKTKKK